MTLTDGDEAGKLFVGGLSWETSKENLQKYFSRYGEVIDSVVMKNNETGRSRGFGFVTFKDASCVGIVLQTGPHELDGRTIDPKACTPRSQQRGKKSDNLSKIFLGGLPANITETEIRNAFSKFGRVVDVVIMYDQEKKKSRGFGFLSFDSEDSIQQACAEHYVNINGKQVECKRAEPRELPRRGRPQQQGPANQWNSGGMGQGQSWGVPAPAGLPPPSASNGMMGGGYQSGWGGPPPQQPPSYNTQQGGWAPQPPAGGGYSSNYQTWTAPTTTGYGSFPPNTPAPAPYGANQPSYQNYGAAPTGYNYNAPTSAPNPPTGDASYTQPNQMPPPTSDPSATQTSNAYGIGKYTPQDASNYGPSKGYTPGGSSAHGYVSSQDYGSAGNYGSQGGSQVMRSQAQAPSYHPYRR